MELQPGALLTYLEQNHLVFEVSHRSAIVTGEEKE